jgi:hypothetical protein
MASRHRRFMQGRSGRGKDGSSNVDSARLLSNTCFSAKRMQSLDNRFGKNISYRTPPETGGYWTVLRPRQYRALPGVRGYGIASRTFERPVT